MRKVEISDGWTIAVPEDCGIVVETAAEDLQRYLGREKNVKMELKRQEILKPSNKTIVVCTNESGGLSVKDLDGYDNYRFEVAQDCILVCGSDDRGTFDGVVYLEDLLSFSKEATVDEVKVTRSPVFRYRFGISPVLDFSDEKLNFLAHSGVNCLHLYYICYIESLTPSEMFPWDGYWMKWDKEVISYINEIFDRAQKYGMECYLYVRGTQAFKASFDEFTHQWRDPGAKVFEKYPDVEGSNRGMDAQTFTDRSYFCTPPCWSSKNYQQFVGETCQNLFRNITNLKGIIIEPMDQTLWCDDTCPKCRGKTLSSRVVEYVKVLKKAAESVRKDAKIVLFHWGYPYHDRSDRDSLISRMPKDVLVINAYTDGRRQVVDGEFLHYGTHYDVSAIPIPGEVFLKDVEVCNSNGLEWVSYHSIGGGMELGPVPYAPVPYNQIQILADLKSFGGSGIFDEGGPYPEPNISAEIYKILAWERGPQIHEMLRKVAERDFGESAAPKIMEAWKRIGDATGKVPSVHYYFYNLEAACNMSLYPAENLRTFIHPRRTRNPWVGYHYLEQLLAVGPKYLEKVTKCFAKAAEEFETGLRLLREATQLADTDRHKAAVEDEAVITEAILCILRSQLNYLEFLQVLIRENPWQREQMLDLMRREVQNTRTLKDLVEKDSRIGYTAWGGRTISPRELEKKAVEMELDIKRLEKGPYVRPLNK